jgi:hypothetical protein
VAAQWEHWESTEGTFMSRGRKILFAVDLAFMLVIAGLVLFDHVFPTAPQPPHSHPFFAFNGESGAQVLTGVFASFFLIFLFIPSLLVALITVIEFVEARSHRT